MSLIVAFVLYSGHFVFLNFSSLNPFSRGVKDYQFTDVIFSKFNDEKFDERIVLVNIGKPDRGEIAQVIQSVRSARVIGVDVIFEGKKETLKDSLLRSVILSSDHLVLADHFTFDKNRVPHTCDTSFCNEHNIGFVNFNTRPNYSVRYYTPYFEHQSYKYPSFSSRIVELYEPVKAKVLKQRGNLAEQIYYSGSQNGFVRLQASDVLDAQFDTTIVKDKIVLLGYMGQSEWDESIKDKFYTPMNDKVGLKSTPDMFGVVIHANIISMVLDGCYINEISKRWNILLNIFWIVGLIIIFRWIWSRVNTGYFKLVRLVQIGLILVWFFIVGGLFYFFHLHINTSIPLVVMVLGWDIVKFYENVVVRHQKFLK